MIDNHGTDNTRSCPVYDATDTERVERGAGLIYRSQNCSAEFDAADDRVESG